MSDYVHRKVVRLPFPEELLERYKVKDAWDCEVYLSEKLGDLWHISNQNGFEIDATDERTYIDWVYYDTYGESPGEFGTARLLTEKELGIAKPYFDKLDVKYKDEDLRIVEYCYYNCCEAPDYYDIVEEDDSSIIAKKI